MYTDFWGLKKPPFDNVPDPTMYVDSHLSVENTIAETLFAIEEGNECLTVIVGDVGLGKTLSLRMILDSLDHEKYKIAFVTNPDMSFVQLLKEIVGQLIGKECEIRGKIELLEVFNKLLFETADEGKKVLIFIDEANAISPTNLESLRLLTNMQDDDRNLFTIVLAGQLEFAKRLEHRSRANLYQRIGTYNKIEKMESEELVKKYVETRMNLAGATRKIFSDEAIHWLWEYSEHGVPRLVNKIAKLCLKAGETNNFHVITGEVVQQIGERFDKMTGPAVQKRRVADSPRAPHASKKEVIRATPEEKSPKKTITIGQEEAPVLWPSSPPPPPPPPPTFQTAPEPEVTTPPPVEPELLKEKPFFEEIEEKAKEEKREEAPEEEFEEPVIEKKVTPPPPPTFQTAPEPEVTTPPPVEPELLKEKPFFEKVEEDKFEEEPEEDFEEPIIEKVESTPVPPPPVETTFKPVKEIIPEVRVIHPPAQEAIEVLEDKDIVTIAGCKITIEIPPHILEQTRSGGIEQKRKIAGVLAAQTLEKNPQLTASPTVDPVSVWSDILNAIMNKL
jgi:type II secretory pathway predicted ATPase ExeA